MQEGSATSATTGASVEALVVAQLGAWPACPAGQVKTFTRAAITEDPRPTVALLRIVEVGGRPVRVDPVWCSVHDSVEEASIRFELLDASDSMAARLARHAEMFGPDEVDAEIEVGAEVERIRRETQREHLAAALEEKARKERKAADAARLIESYLDDRDGQFGINMLRGDAKKPFWIILFRERWERERFRDWFRWQRHRFAAWAEFLEAHPAIDLDRLLLAEMLEVERRVKKSGGGAGGRRPLRFWRGEEA